jgi:surfactin synthase thioesterase subunit
MTTLTSYRLEPDFEKLKTAIVCVASSSDRPSNNEAAVAAWREMTSGLFSFRVAKGGHFAFSDDPKCIMPWIGQELQVREVVDD